MDNLDSIVRQESVQPVLSSPPPAAVQPVPSPTPVDSLSSNVPPETLPPLPEVEPVNQTVQPQPATPPMPPIDGADMYLNKELTDLIGDLPSMLAEEDARYEEGRKLAAEDPVIQEDRQARITVAQREPVRQNIVDDDIVPDFMDDNRPYSPDRYAIRDDVPDVPVEDDDTDADVDEVARMVREYDVVRPDLPEKPAVRMLRDPAAPRVRTVNANRSSRAIGDQAFDNLVSNFKRDNCGVVSVPLVNSGFCVDMVGSGVVDVETLYGPLDRNADPRQYRISQMKTVIRNIAGTYPPVEKRSIMSMIHRYDFDLMVFGHVCATIRTVQTAITCPKCGANFRVECDTANLLLNENEIMEKRAIIETAERAEDNSLLATRREVETSDGFVISIGHPTYYEYMRMLENYPTMTERMDEVEKRRFDTMSNMMAMIRSIRFPNGAASSNLYQHYKAFGLLGDRDATTVQEIIAEMEKEVIIPRLGIREVRCPRCGEVIRDTAFESMADLIFLHATISDLLRKAESGDVSK